MTERSARATLPLGTMGVDYICLSYGLQTNMEIVQISVCV